MIYRREVDGLRAVAVIPVILFHAGFTFCGGGFIGVDVFFVISGYLITTIIVEDLDAGRFSIRKFYERRARRILPALYLMMILCIITSWFVFLPRDMKLFSESVGATSVFSSNILFWRDTGYFDTAAELKPLLHTWSLGVEEQFYIVFPIFLWLMWRLGKSRITGILLFLSASSLLLAQWGAHNKPAAAFFLLPTRAWELGLGSLTAFYLIRKPQLFNENLFFNQIYSVIGFLLIIISVFYIRDTTPYPSFYTLIPTLGTALVLLFAGPQTQVGALLGYRPIVAIGLISYGAYLWHQPLFSFYRYYRLGEQRAWVSTLLVLTALILAYVGWRYVEQPFRRREKVSTKSVFVFSGMGMLGFIIFGLAGHFSNGFVNERFTEEQQTLFNTLSVSPLRDECHTSGSNFQEPHRACRYFSEPFRWAVFGNSHGVELAYSLAVRLKAHNEGLIQLTFSDCPPTLGRSYEGTPGCSAWTQEAVDYLINNETITHIVVSYRTHGLALMDNDKRDHDMPVTDADMTEALQWKSYVDTIRRFSDAGKIVIVVLQAPQLPKSAAHYIMQENKNFQFVSGVELDRWKISSEKFSQYLIDLPKGAILVNPADLFCDMKRCAAIMDGQALYFDDHHMSLGGADIVAKEILRKVDGQFSSSPPVVTEH